MYALIKDETSCAQRLPLATAVRTLVAAAVLEAPTHVVVRMACGYGRRINDLDDATEEGEVEIAWADLMSIADTQDEWFYDLQVRDMDGAFAFGIVDSAAVVIQGTERVVRRVAASFSDVSFHEGEWIG